MVATISAGIRGNTSLQEVDKHLEGMGGVIDVAHGYLECADVCQMHIPR
jgi:hypothetical protein